MQPTADSKWVRAQFLNFRIIEMLNDSVARVDVEDAIDILGMVGLDCIARVTWVIQCGGDYVNT